MSEVTILFILASIIAYSLISKSIANSILTLPIIFTFVGFGLSFFAGDFIGQENFIQIAKIVAEVALILVLFADASHVRFAKLASNYTIPLRMLIIGMPLTIGLGVAVVYGLSPESGLAMALLTTAILTPTDAALGQSVVESMEVPEKLSQAINVESGLNDGLALPFVLVGAIFASTMLGQDPSEMQNLPWLVGMQLVLGPIAGIGVGWSVAKALDWAQSKDRITEASPGVVFVATAFLAYSVAQATGGNGFIAAFVAGATFGNAYRHNIHFISEFMEGQGQLLTMSAFLIFGAVLLPLGIEHFSIQATLTALAFLTFVRIIPIFLSLTGSQLAWREKLFLGWFGTRGLASILFSLIMVEEYQLPHEDELLACVVLTVFLSIILHGISSTPLAKRFGKSNLYSSQSLSAN